MFISPLNLFVPPNALYTAEQLSGGKERIRRMLRVAGIDSEILKWLLLADWKGTDRAYAI